MAISVPEGRKFISMMFYSRAMLRDDLGHMSFELLENSGALHRQETRPLARFLKKGLQNGIECVRVDFAVEDSTYIVTEALPRYLGPLDPGLADALDSGLAGVFPLASTTPAAVEIMARMRVGSCDTWMQLCGGPEGYVYKPSNIFKDCCMPWNNSADVLEVFVLPDGHPAAPRQVGRVGRGVRAVRVPVPDHVIPKGVVLCMYDEFGVLATDAEVQGFPTGVLEYKLDIHCSNGLCVLGNPCGKCPGPLINTYQGIKNEPNCGFVVVARDRPGGGGVEFRVAVVSLLDIPDGDELLTDYGQGFVVS